MPEVLVKVSKRLGLGTPLIFHRAADCHLHPCRHAARHSLLDSIPSAGALQAESSSSGR